MKRLKLQFALVASVFAFEVGCGGTVSPTSPTPVPTPKTSGTQSTEPAPTPLPLPTPPREGCAPWPVQLAEMFAKLPLPEGLCLVYDDGPGASTIIFSSRTLISRDDKNASGRIGAIAHELGHAHQYWAILNAGFPDVSPYSTDESAWLQEYWQQTPEGMEYMRVAGWQFLGFGGECNRWAAAACWTQVPQACEPSFCRTVWPGTGYQNPKEENAQFIGQWYNAPGITGVNQPWGSENLTRLAPLRAAWAKVWLP